MKAKKTPLFILITYILMQLSSFVFVLPIKAIINMLYPEASKDYSYNLILGWTTLTTFTLGLLVTLFFILRDKDFFKNAFVNNNKKASTPVAIFWGIFGFILVLTGQMLAGLVEQAIGIKPGSENTADLSMMVSAVPLAFICIVFIGPFLEEVVFRRVIFGSLNQTTNFFVAALVSAIIFGLIHMELSHLLIYATTGLIFAFLYNHTKRLLTTIIAHMMLNGFVMFVNLYQAQILDYLKSIQP